jgi:hypothetical protein
VVSGLTVLFSRTVRHENLHDFDRISDFLVRREQFSSYEACVSPRPESGGFCFHLRRFGYGVKGQTRMALS